MLKNLLLLIILIAISNESFGKIIYPHNDQKMSAKKAALEKMNMIMGPNGSSQYTEDSDKIILWANSAPILERTVNGKKEYIVTELPSFTAATEQNKKRLKGIMDGQCQCDIPLDDIGGILIADPFTAATMYFRAGWLNYDGTEVDGQAAPIVIMYHEFSHVKDYLLNKELFFDMAASFDRRWKNLAEKSAVEQQNDFVLLLGFYEGIHISRRQSYGKNELYKVEHFFDI